MLSLEYICGFVSGCGSFTQTTLNGKTQYIFQIKTSIDNHDLLEQIVVSLNLANRVYRYESHNQKYSQLLVRDRHSILNIIIPAFNNQLFGSKGIQFNTWRDNILLNCSTWNYRNIKSRSNPQKI